MNKHYLRFGEKVTVELPYSEVCMHMRIAGKVLDVELIPTERYACAQLWLDGRQFSFPITVGEAGIYSDENGFYCYEVKQSI